MEEATPELALEGQDLYTRKQLGLEQAGWVRGMNLKVFPQSGSWNIFYEHHIWETAD